MEPAVVVGLLQSTLSKLFHPDLIRTMVAQSVKELGIQGVDDLIGRTTPGSKQAGKVSDGPPGTEKKEKEKIIRGIRSYQIFGMCKPSFVDYSYLLSLLSSISSPL